jgi:hypothetical protein
MTMTKARIVIWTLFFLVVVVMLALVRAGLL